MCVHLAIPSAVKDVRDQILATAGNVIGQPYGLLVSDVPVPMITYGLKPTVNVSLCMKHLIRATAVDQVTHGMTATQYV